MITSVQSVAIQGPHRPRGFLKTHHIAYFVKNQAATLDFYENIIG